MRAMRVSRRQVSVVLVLITTLLDQVGVASPLPTPTHRPILTISGKIKRTNSGDTAQFDRLMLEALGTTEIETTTPWYTGKVRFEGVSLKRLMEYVESEGKTVVATALNDYTTEIPIEDFAKFGTILALKRNGEYMAVRDKGPLFIIYPFDSKSELKSQTYYGRSAWQVTKLMVK